MQNKTFILAVLMSALTTLGIIVLLPHLSFARTDPEAFWTNGLYETKLSALHKLQRDRIYVVGGSSSLFSLDTETLSHAAGRPVVNLATHAGLGLTYILDRAEREMQPGDVIIFTPEYSILEQPAEPSQFTLEFAAFFDKPYVATRPVAERTHFLIGYDVVGALRETAKAMLHHGAQSGRPDITLDELGNARGNSVEGSANDKGMFDSGSGPPAPVSADALVALRKFSDLAHRKQVRILALPPSLILLPGWDSQTYRAFRRNVRSTLQAMGMTVRGDDSTGWVEPAGIYDSNYHANNDGRAVYTGKIAVLLCREISCPNPPR